MSQLGLGMTTATDDRPRSPRGRRGGGIAVAIAMVAVLAVLAVVVVTVVHWANQKPDYTGPGHGKVVVVVRTGDSVSQVADTLAKAGVVRSASAFVDAASGDPNGGDIRPGTYQMREEMSAASALDLILDPQSRISSTALVREGLRVDQTLETLAQATRIPLAQLRAAAANAAAIGLPAWAHGNPEGFLFPAKYDVDPGSDATRVLGAMVRRFDQAVSDTGLVERAKAVHLTPYQVLVVASIVQAEGRTKDFPKIARSILNRLDKGMRLQLNSTVNYVLKNNKSKLSTADIAVQSPYNTYLVAGLPPGPIDSPGEDAINAVLAPTAGPWLYWVTVDPSTGETKFTDSYAEFLQFKAELKANGG
jgi:peptidoglycan lytic transglycosylase G